MVEDSLLPLDCARLYLAPAHGAFWRWSTDRTAIEWNDGETIVLAEELFHFVRHCTAAGRGLPPLSAIVLLFAGTRPGWPARWRELDPGAAPLAPAALLAPLRSAAERAEFVEVVLQAAPTTNVPFARAVARAIDDPLPGPLFRMRSQPSPPFAQVVEWVRTGLRGLTSEQVALRQRTGLTELPAPDPEVLPLRERTARLLASMDDDPDLAGLARLARQLMAALRVPQLPPRTLERPSGGVAGLCNRGALDRLALSELAMDDEVLAIRIALQEALYVEPESPRGEPACHRRVLLDSSTAMWGSARVTAVGVALALRGLADRATGVEVFAAQRNRLYEVDLDSRQGLTEQLARLDDAVDPRAAFAALQALPRPSGQTDRLEWVLVTHRDHTADPAVRATLQAPANGTLFVVDLTEDSRLRLWSVAPAGWRLLREAVFALHSGREASPSSALPRFYNQPTPPLGNLSGHLQCLRRLMAIGLQPNTLYLRTNRGKLHTLRFGGPTRDLQLVLTDGRATGERTAMVTLRPVPGDGPHLPLQRALLGKDLHAYSDPRGLLHLVPVGGDEPELSLVLRVSGPLSAWSSDGRYFGARHFHIGATPDTRGTTTELAERLVQLARSRR